MYQSIVLPAVDAGVNKIGTSDRQKGVSHLVWWCSVH
jgi:hypothetical protein